MEKINIEQLAKDLSKELKQDSFFEEVELKESLDCEVQNLNGQDTCIEINKA